MDLITGRHGRADRESAGVEGVYSDVFRAGPAHEPTTDEERNFRLDYYTCKLAIAASEQLTQALMELRGAADRLQPPELGTLALKTFKEEEFSAAIKEIVCIWIHQEAVDQGGETLPLWLRTFFRLGFGAADYMIAKPSAWEVMHAYGRCHDMVSLCMEACCRVCGELGFGVASMTFSPAVMPIVLQTGALRQGILKDSLGSPIKELRERAK